jgi:NADH-quinone oxidoreductase subunit E
MGKNTNAQVGGEADLAAEVERLLNSLDLGESPNLIGLLQEVQERFGYLPREALSEISHRTRIPLSRIYGVVTFYAQFYTEPRGRHTVRCCRGTACHVKGAGRALEAVKKQLGIEEGETTEDMVFYLETVACLGTCFLAPVMMIDNQYFGLLTPQKAERVLRSYRDKKT